MVTHIFFDLHGTLINASLLRPCYSHRKCEILAARYGGTLQAWQEADRILLAEWDAYHADLNFSGDEGLRDYYEALFRTTRALFRLAKTPEPPKDELLALSRWLPGEAPRQCSALYPEVENALKQLSTSGYRLGIATSMLQSQARAILEGSAMIALFHAPVAGADTFEQFDKDVRWFRQTARLAGVHPRDCLIVDNHARSLIAAKRAGMKTVLIQRQPGQSLECEVDACLNDLSGLPDRMPAL